MRLKIDDELKHCIDEAWRQYHAFRNKLVKGPCPILFFGDSAAYSNNSRCKIVAVGLKPSFREFEDSPPHVAFRGKPTHYARYLSALNRYFKSKPYRSWFDPSYEFILKGLDASYYGALRNTALHTDLCSPLATKPTWSELVKHHKEFAEKLQAHGAKLWNQLISYLRPDLILISIQRKLVETYIAPLDRWKTIYTIQRKNPCEVRAYRFANARVIFGIAANVPFGKVSRQAKLEIGRFLKEHYRL